MVNVYKLLDLGHFIYQGKYDMSYVLILLNAGCMSGSSDHVICSNALWTFA